MNDQADGIQLTLDVVGLYPGFGNFADITNVVISTARGNYGEAGVNLLAAVPALGQYIAAGKITETAAAIGVIFKSGGIELPHSEKRAADFSWIATIHQI